MHEKSKVILPPWPLCYKLPRFSDLLSWSPCGTRIACAVHPSNIVIVDQRCGPFRNNRNNNNGTILNDHRGHGITDLKYSPDGRFLVSADDDGFVRLWDNTRNYEQLQEWNMTDEVGEELTGDSYVSVSACSKFMAVLIGLCAFLQDVEKGKTIKSLVLPFHQNENRQKINAIIFSLDDRDVFICRNKMFQVWYPYLDDDDEDRLITIWRHAVDPNFGRKEYAFSPDNTMVAIYNS